MDAIDHHALAYQRVVLLVGVRLAPDHGDEAEVADARPVVPGGQRAADVEGADLGDRPDGGGENATTGAAASR